MASFGKRLLDGVAIDLLAPMNTLGIFPSSDETPPASGVRSGAPHTPDLAARILRTLCTGLSALKTYIVMKRNGSVH